MRNNLKFTLFRTFYNSHGSNIDLTRKDMSSKLMIFRSNRKKGGVPLCNRKRSYLKRISGHDTGKEGHGIRDSFAK